MKRYRLIKKYPGSPELGAIWDECSTDCPKYPEFWEEVIEPTFEILSFKRNNSSQNYKDTLFILDEKTKLFNPTFRHSNLTLEHCLKGGFYIHSVKRLSDDEVFTIGDKIIEKNKIYLEI
jgi:hypothetical protein